MLLAIASCGQKFAGDTGNGADQAIAAASRDLLLQFDLRGGLLLSAATEVPRWSLYGDGLVVWTEEEEPTPGFTRKVWAGFLNNDEIQALVEFLEASGFWQLEDDYRPAHEVSASGERVRLDPAAAPDQVWSVLTVHTGGKRKRVTVYPADWEGTPAAYLSCSDRLLQTRPQEAQEFEAQAFRLEARRVSMTGLAHAPRVWPFQSLELPVPSGELILTREQGLAVAEFLQSSPPVALQEGKPFGLRLLGEPPR